MAELLLTLGIIGIVASLTMTVLISNYKKFVYVNQLKKSVSVVENGFKMILASDGVSKLTETSLWDTFASNWNLNSSNSEFINYYAKYFKILKINSFNLNTYKQLNDNGIGNRDCNAFVLADGTYILFQDILKQGNSLSVEDCNKVKQLGGNVCDVAINLVYIDVNGAKGPNRFGRDMFQFSLANDGMLVPSGGKDYALFQEQVSLSENQQYWKTSSSGALRCNVGDSGFTCAARIIESGWNMDY